MSFSFPSTPRSQPAQQAVCQKEQGPEEVAVDAARSSRREPAIGKQDASRLRFVQDDDKKKQDHLVGRAPRRRQPPIREVASSVEEQGRGRRSDAVPQAVGHGCAAEVEGKVILFLIFMSLCVH